MKILCLMNFSLFHSHIQYCIIDWGKALKTVIRPVQVLQTEFEIHAFRNRTSSANNFFKLLNILKVSDLYQPHLNKFMYKHNADNLPSSFDNVFTKLHCIHDHGTKQHVSEHFHHKCVRTNYSKTLLLSFFCFITFWTHVFCLNCTIDLSQSLNKGLACSCDTFDRPSPKLCCLVYWLVFYCWVLTAQTWLDCNPFFLIVNTCLLVYNTNPGCWKKSVGKPGLILSENHVSLNLDPLVQLQDLDLDSGAPAEFPRSRSTELATCPFLQAKTSSSAFFRLLFRCLIKQGTMQ